MRAAMLRCITARLLFARKEVSTDSTPSLHPIRNDVRGFFFVRRHSFRAMPSCVTILPPSTVFSTRASRRLLAMYGV